MATAKRSPTIGYRKVVQDLYRGLLDREADDLGLAEKVHALEAGETNLVDTVRSFILSEEFGAAHSGHDTSDRLTNDQTQFGELEALITDWANEVATHRIVVDVGARGKARSNSYDLMKWFGWRGILIEANPNLIETIRTEFAGLDATLINCAVSDYSGRASFHIGVNDDVSSLNAEAAAGWGPITGEVSVAVERLGNILRDLAVPVDFDLLSIDIEGEDVKVLNDVVDAFGYRPKWIIIEASYDYATKSLLDLPTSEVVRQSYHMVGQTPANLILKRV